MNLHTLVADKIEENPECLVQATATLEHWATLGVMPTARLTAWRRLLSNARRSRAGMRAVLKILRDDSPRTQRLRDFAPFAGILSREERRTVFQPCTYDH